MTKVQNLISSPIEKAIRLAGNLGIILRKHRLTLAVAESATGGFISHTLTEIPNCSDYYYGGVVAYSNDIKSELLGVPKSILEEYGAVSKPTVLAMAKALGCTKAGVIETTFRDETESDLIGEQVVLVGGIIELIRHGYEVLVELGYPPELAYFEACNESKLIIDQIYRSGVLGMLKAVSDTAKYGGLSVGPKIIDSHVRANMIAAAKLVRDGSFAKEWLNEDAQGRPNMTKQLEAWANHPLEVIGNQIRKMSGLKE